MSAVNITLFYKKSKYELSQFSSTPSAMIILSGSN